MATKLHFTSEQIPHGCHCDLQVTYPLREQMEIAFDVCQDVGVMGIRYYRPSHFELPPIQPTHVIVPMPEGEISENLEEMIRAIERAWRFFQQFANKTSEWRALEIGSLLNGQSFGIILDGIEELAPSVKTFLAKKKLETQNTDSKTS